MDFPIKKLFVLSLTTSCLIAMESKVLQENVAHPQQSLATPSMIIAEGAAPLSLRVHYYTCDKSLEQNWLPIPAHDKMSLKCFKAHVAAAIGKSCIEFTLKEIKDLKDIAFDETSEKTLEELGIGHHSVIWAVKEKKS